MAIRVISHEDAYGFMMSGRSVVTVFNPKTGKAFKYTITRSKNQNKYWVIVDGNYIGHISEDIYYDRCAGVTKQNKALAITAFRWTWNHIVAGTLLKHIRIIHDGRCSYCNRLLTDEESRAIGLGPGCRKKLNISPVKQTA